MIIALVAAVLVLPVLLQLVRALLALHLWAIIIVLPAGVLLRTGAIEGPRSYVAVCIATGLVVLAWRRWARQREDEHG